jgi:hypothetical protein
MKELTKKMLAQLEPKIKENANNGKVVLVVLQSIEPKAKQDGAIIFCRDPKALSPALDMRFVLRISRHLSVKRSSPFPNRSTKSDGTEILK